MSNEIANVAAVNPMAVLNQFSQDNSVASADITSVQTTSWVPSLSVAYGTSKAVKERRANIGDFVLAGQTSLGTSIKAVVCTYRLRAAVWNDKTKQYGDSCYHMHNNELSVKNDEQYNKFLNQALRAGEEIQSGTEFLLFLPEQNVFAIIFLKKTLTSYIQPIWNCGPGRLIQLSTMLIKGKYNEWYGFDVIPLARALEGSSVKDPNVTLAYDVKMPADLFEKNYNLFLKPNKTESVEDADTGSQERAR
jgi:hypothetical protein